MQWVLTQRQYVENALSACVWTSRVLFALRRFDVHLTLNKQPLLRYCHELQPSVHATLFPCRVFFAFPAVYRRFGSNRELCNDRRHPALHMLVYANVQKGRSACKCTY